MNIDTSVYPPFYSAASELEPPASGNSLVTAEPSNKAEDFLIQDEKDRLPKRGIIILSKKIITIDLTTGQIIPEENIYGEKEKGNYPIIDYFTVAVLKTQKDIAGYFGNRGRQDEIRNKFNGISRQLFVDLVLRDGPICKRCGGKTNLTVDHIRPIFFGGNNEIDNLQLLCKSCNSRKGTR